MPDEELQPTPKVLALADQIQCEAQNKLALEATRYHERGWTFLDRLPEFLDEDPEQLAILLAAAIGELASLSKALGLLE